MSSNEKRIAIGVLAAVILFAGGALAWRAGSRAEGDAGGARASGASASSAADRATDDAARAAADDAITRLEQRLARMESVLDELQRDVSRLERSSSRGPSSVASRGDGGAIDVPAPGTVEAAAWIEELLEDPEALDSVYDALDAERVTRETAAANAANRSDAPQRDREMTALGEALGLTMYQQDGVAEVYAATEQRRAELAARAEELLRGPGPLDAEFRELHKELVAEKRAIYAERSERLTDLLGAQKLRELRGYENQQDRKAELLDTLLAPGFPKPEPKAKSKAGELKPTPKKR